MSWRTKSLTIFSISSYLLFIATPAPSQIIPDNTLPVNSVVTPDGNIWSIGAGTPTGTNLFHSFSEFSVPAGNEAFFNHAPEIQNIFTRVTGGNISQIDGIIRANGIANLFLLNPAGIIFGKKAQLNIGGSFISSTADSILFQDGSEFSAVNPQAPPLLTINVPLGLQFGGTPGNITNTSQAHSPTIDQSDVTNSIGNPVGLRVSPGQTLALVGGNVTLDNGNLTALGGRIELGSVRSGQVSLTPVTQGWQLGYQGVQNFQDISLTSQSWVDASGAIYSNLTTPPNPIPEINGNSGSIQVQAQSLTINNSGISAMHAGNLTGGSIQVVATSIDLGGETISSPPLGNAIVGLFTQNEGTGNPGSIDIKTTQLRIQDGAQISTNSFNFGQAGNITIEASDLITIQGMFSDKVRSSISAGTNQNGNGGNVTINTGRLRVEDGGEILTLVDVDDGMGQGNSGNITIQARHSIIFRGQETNVLSENRGNGNQAGNILLTTGQLLVEDGAEISTIAKLGQSGNLAIQASHSVNVSGSDSQGISSRLITGRILTAEIDSTLPLANAGTLTLLTPRLTVANGAQLSTSSQFGTAGTLTIQAPQSILVTGTTPQGLPSRILAETGGSGKGGNLDITTRSLTLQDGGKISTATFGQGQGGDLQIRAFDSVTVTGARGFEFSGILATAEANSTGNSGNLRIDTRQLRVQNGGQVSTSSFGNGNAGTLNLQATDFVEVSGSSARFRSLISSQANSGIGNGGNIRVTTPHLTVTNDAQITASTASFGAGGNIEINTNQVSLNTGGQIISLTVGAGRGGTLNINAKNSLEISGLGQNGLPSGLFTQSRPEIIGATAFNLGNAGTLTVNTPTLTLTDGGAISADTLADGNGGDINIKADHITLSGRSTRPSTSPLADADGLLPSRITALSEGSGSAGTLTLNSDTLTLDNRARIAVSSSLGSPNAAAGDLNLTANVLQLDNSTLSADTNAGAGGNINLLSTDIQLRNSSQITTNANTTTGGNITIDTETLTALDNSDISANAQQGAGGRVTITADGIFGTQFRDQTTGTSDITATSELGPEFSGTVTLNTPDIDPTQGLIEFPETPIDISQLIDQNLCQVSKNSELTATGRQGLPTSPTAPLTPSTLWQDNRTPIPNFDHTPESSAPVPAPDFSNFDHTPESSAPVPAPDFQVFIEAQGINIQPDGIIELTPNPNTITPITPWEIPPGCQLLSSTVDYYASLGNYYANTPKTIPVRKIQFIGDTIPLTSTQQQELTQLLQSWENQELTFSQLIELRTKITQFYIRQDIGYITTGALIPPQKVDPNIGLLKIQIVGGTLEKIEVKTDGRLHPNYIKKRLELATNGPLNQLKLIEALGLLELDSDLIETIDAEISKSIYPGQSILTINVIENKTPVSMELTAENSRAPSIGSFERGGTVGYRNLFGWADQVNIGYGNTDGGNRFNTTYLLPINAKNGTVELSYDQQSNQIIEEPFEQVEIESDSKTYQLTFRQPIYQKPSEEFAVGLSFSRRESQTSILGEDYPLSPGADENGETRLSVMRLFQDWLKRDQNQVMAARSEFSLGLGLFDATVNQNAPDSQFFAWRGQGQYARRLGEDSLLVVRGIAQLTPSDLVPMEEFGLGGLGSVRGYRQDSRLTDNGVLLSAEVRVPVISSRSYSVQVVPFVDGGAGWNTGSETPEQNVLASVGLGLQMNWRRGLTLRLDYGIPLVEIDTPGNTWQENGLYFSIRSSPF